MPAITEGFSEVLDILKGLFSGLKTAVQIPENHRKEMRDALADTAELIDETLTILKQHLTTVISELKFGDRLKARQMIFELGDFRGWEDKYRQFQLCDTLRNAANNLERKGLYKFLNNLAINDPQVIQQRMWDYIGGETNAARSVGTMIQNLSDLADFSEADFDKVVNELTVARDEVGKWRQSFIDLELEIRNSF